MSLRELKSLSGMLNGEGRAIIRGRDLQLLLAVAEAASAVVIYDSKDADFCGIGEMRLRLAELEAG